MICLDTSALIAILADEPDAAAFAAKIRTDAERICGAHVVLEACMRLATLAGALPSVVEVRVLRALKEVGVVIVPITQATAHLAVEAFEHYGKGRHKAGLNFGDCLSYACAKAHGARLLFKATDFAQTDIARA